MVYRRLFIETIHSQSLYYDLLLSKTGEHASQDDLNVKDATKFERKGSQYNH